MIAPPNLGTRKAVSRNPKGSTMKGLLYAAAFGLVSYYYGKKAYGYLTDGGH